MREVLFRGKCLNNGQWVYGYVAPYIDMQGNHKCRILTDGDMFYAVDPATVGECTGKKIVKDNLFDGDICTFTYIPNPTFNNPHEYAVTAVVEWSERNFGWCFHNIQPRSKKHPSRKQYFPFGDFSICGLKIIGNKWDNPELLIGSVE